LLANTSVPCGADAEALPAGPAAPTSPDKKRADADQHGQTPKHETGAGYEVDPIITIIGLPARISNRG
jgi:hypothetical protein